MKQALAALFLLLPLPAQAAVCDTYAMLAQAMLDQYGETPAYRAVTAGGNLLEILLNAETRTWTALMVYPDKDVACSVAAGEGWKETEDAGGGI